MATKLLSEDLNIWELLTGLCWHIWRPSKINFNQLSPWKVYLSDQRSRDFDSVSCENMIFSIFDFIGLINEVLSMNHKNGDI